MERIQNIRKASSETLNLIEHGENILLEFNEKQITARRNGQNRNIKQILGHLVDSCTNNHNRIVRLQYTKRLIFPDYTPDNDDWIRIQNYEGYDWHSLIQLWKLYGYHLAYIMEQVQKEHLDNLWTDGFIEPVSLEDMIIGFPQHFELHLNEINELLQ